MLNDFVCCGDLYSWLKGDCSGTQYSNRDLYTKLIDFYEVKNGRLSEGREEQRCRGAFIRAETESPLPDSGISRMYWVNYIHISIKSKDLMYKNNKEVMNFVSDKLKEHYLRLNGEVPGCGKILKYKYHHCDGREYLFDTAGNII